MQPFVAEGLSFQKMLGSGHNFGLIPTLSRYVFLGVWSDEIHARLFFQSEAWLAYSNQTIQTSTLWLSPLQSHGLWDGQNPFVVNSNALAFGPSSLIAVLTRATIRPRRLIDFWRHVPQARQRLQEQKDNLLFGIGVGEKPVMQQCTISVWRNASAVEQFAYRQSGHKEVVRLTRQRQWYTEELFARFAVLQAEGDAFAHVQALLAAFPTDKLP